MKRSSPLFKLLMAVNLVILLFSNISCAIPEMETDDGVEYSILGTWESSWGEKFEISETEFKNYYGEAASYSGNYIYQKKLNNTSGYIYLRYTRAYEETDEDKSSDSSWTTWDGETYYRYSTSAPDVGKWYAVYYSELTDSSVKITGAAYGAKDTLEEAILEFTVEAGYFSIPSECVKTASANGVIPQSNTAVPSGTVLATTYLSNFAGNYNLSNGVTLNVGAKINIHQDTNHYWNANVVNPSYDVATKTYSFFLLHSSQPNASGSIDPGITGNEQFISQQGLFWSRMTLTAHPGSQWEIKWSSVWTDSMQTAENLTLDKTDSFTGPATSMIHYSYKFYFGNPTVNSAGWCEVDKGSLIYQTEFDSALPTDKTWSQILTQYDIASKINMPEGKEADYWWYSTGAITGIQSSYVSTLTDIDKPASQEYEFYLATTDEIVTPPVTQILANGVWGGLSGTTWSPFYLVVSGSTGVLYYTNGASKTLDFSNADTTQSFQDFGEEYPKVRVWYDNGSFKNLKFFKASNSTIGYTSSSYLTAPVSGLWLESFTDSSNNKWIVTGGTSNSKTVRIGNNTFTYTYSIVDEDTEVSMPSASGERNDVEVDKCLTLADNQSESIREYELFITSVDFGYGNPSWMYGFYDSYEDPDTYELVTDCLAQGYITEEQAQIILSHFE